MQSLNSEFNSQERPKIDKLSDKTMHTADGVIFVSEYYELFKKKGRKCSGSPNLIRLQNSLGTQMHHECNKKIKEDKRSKTGNKKKGRQVKRENQAGKII